MSEASNQPHVLISYQWGAKSSVFKIKERLKAAGYKVCTDVENTGNMFVHISSIIKERLTLDV